ncbi:hypothetical protein E4U09_004702 [Claviceps aff. purpurea]|uniref:Uncharacterized protein n=1 Tax=Claviceps aff. purpurea TaxID=1967640 RepID=A0A9P7QCS8_9HYPO|nr:hypothetical protein E4U09_004702 [Claviceps aff. purpurea]
MEIDVPRGRKRLRRRSARIILYHHLPAWANANRAAAQRRRTASVEAAAVSQEARSAVRASQKARKAPLTAAADYDHHGVPVFYRRGEPAGDTPAMQQARRDKVSISRAHRAQARDDLQPSPSQTPPLPDIMRGRQELEALHRRHEEERMAGASPSPTPAIRKHMGQRRDRAVSPSPSSPFSRLSSSLRSPSVASQTSSMTSQTSSMTSQTSSMTSQTSSMTSQTISMAESLGSEYQPSSHGSHPEPSFPQSSHPSTLPPLPTPDADVPYIEGTTTLDDLAITNTDIDCIKSWRENVDKNKQQRCDRCNCFWLTWTSFRVSARVAERRTRSAEIQGVDNVDRACPSCGRQRINSIWV